MKPIPEKWNQIAEHVPGSRKPMQQEQCRSIGPTGFAIRDLETANIGGAVVNRTYEDSCEGWCVIGLTAF